MRFLLLITLLVQEEARAEFFAAEATSLAASVAPLANLSIRVLLILIHIL